MKGGNIITGDTRELIKDFRNISSKGWIKSGYNGTGSIGLTFEKELKNNPNSLFFPDFNGIEIKCSSRFSRYPFSLFSCAFEGPTFPEINRIINLYGYPDYRYPDKNVLRVDLDAKELKKKGKYKFKLFIDDIKEKMFLEVYDLKDRLIERKSFIYLDTIISRLKLKLNHLAIVYGSKKKLDDIFYYRYYKIDIYDLKDELSIIDLLKEGKIIVTLECRVGKSNENDGKYKNKNLVFKINRDNLECLFNKKYTINEDYNIDMDYNSFNQNFFILG